MTAYNELRQQYKPTEIKILLIAESPPPGPDGGGSRHFYRATPPREGDRLFVNTIKAFYPEAAEQTEVQIEAVKEKWLRRFQEDGNYLIEALPTSLRHEVAKPQRQQLILEHLPELLQKVRELASPHTKIILIKSNVFVVAAEPLKTAGFRVLNHELVDYPGQYNQRAYREKISALIKS